MSKLKSRGETRGFCVGGCWRGEWLDGFGVEASQVSSLSKSLVCCKEHNALRIVAAPLKGSRQLECICSAQSVTTDGVQRTIE